jgi:type IV pilus assembly protein PilC
MPKFRYAAMDANGSETQGVLEAESQAQAVQAIRAKELFPTRVTEEGRGGGPVIKRPGTQSGGGSKKGMDLLGFFKGRVKPKELMVFTRQLATLIEAGLPLLRGLRILLKQEKNPAMRAALEGMGEAVESGATFSESLGQYPRAFDELYVNMIRAGEAGGVLDQVLLRLAEFMEKAEKIKNKVKSAMIYPMVVLGAAVGIMVFLMVYIIPRFNEIFKDLLGGEALPPLTQAVISFSNFIRYRWPVLIAIIIAVVVAFQMLKRTPKGARLFDRFKLKSPMIGHLFTLSVVARFSRTLGTLMGSGVPVLQALNIVRDTAGNLVLADAIQSVHDNVKEGETMAAPLGSSGVFPEMVISMVDVGEETGALPEMLVKIADNYDDEVDTAVEGLTSIIEPIMIILLAVIVGTIVIAMFVPMVKIITEMASGV